MKTLNKDLPDPLEYLGKEKQIENKKDILKKEQTQKKSTGIYMLKDKPGKVCYDINQK